MKKVLVTGATGFIGNYVIHELLKNKYHVIATSVTREKAQQKDWHKDVSYIPFDLKTVSTKENYYSLFDSPDLLIHLAWEGLPNYKESYHLTESLPTQFTFLQNLIQHGLKDIAITGTCFEYGMQEGCLSEDMPSMPSNSYAVAKNKLRILLNELESDNSFQLKWARLFYMYGKGQNPNSLLSQLQYALDRGDSVFNMSPGDQLRDYLPVEKVAEYIVRIATQTDKTGIINCCSGVPISVKQLVENYLADSGKKIALNLGYFPYSDLEPRNFWGDIKKLKSIG